MTRRELITLIGGAAAVWSSRAHTQQPALRTIGWLHLGSKSSTQDEVIEGFRSGLSDLGYTEGKNIRVLYRFADRNADRLSALASELVSLGARVIVTGGTTAIRAAHDAAPNVPIVTWAGADPTLMGWAQTMAKPGGMITGLFEAGSTDKRLELLKAVRPQAIRFGFLMTATNPGAPLWKLGAHDAAQALGIKLAIIEVKDRAELADAFDRMGSLGVEALAINPDPVFESDVKEIIAELARIHKLPTVFEGTFPAGGLLAFTNDYVYLARRSASYVDQILKGTAPGDLAMEQGRVYKLLVNLKTAKELGITIPPSVLARADEIIE